jgi:hypothetical protein
MSQKRTQPPAAGIIPYPFNEENHTKNCTTDHHHSWFSNVYPNATEADYQTYKNTNRCKVCCAKIDNKRIYEGDVVCDNCYEILHCVMDLEHLIQLKEYLKEKKR